MAVWVILEDTQNPSVDLMFATSVYQGFCAVQALSEVLKK